ncbi:cyanophycinase [uncultured Thermanaerothrix sp.]|uniref:cyanophycinase n=1 Tax=uncultured Thermanaerothrix sp. TaxID=1195149 RepID=UPI002613E721|nr:cyanophycinase [uncultured Thermanaerothrix sp.]
MQTITMIMGGGITSTSECLRAFLNVAGGASARVVILPTACHDPLAVQDYVNGLKVLGLRYPPTILPVWERTQAEDRALVRALAYTSAVLILGGDLKRLLRVVRGTRLHRMLWQAHTVGVVVGGISAGAAAMGTLVGGLEDSLTPHWEFALGMLPRAVIVPHFHQRGRYQALWRIMLDCPGWLGLGVDEATGVIMGPWGVQVVGAGQVTLITAVRGDNASSERSMWIMQLGAGQSLTWGALPWLLAEPGTQVDNSARILFERSLSPVTRSANIMFHLFKQ